MHILDADCGRTPVNLAFCLTKYFPTGGLQRDFLRMAACCLDRGHAVDVYTGEWHGDKPEGLKVVRLKAAGWTNHRRTESLAAALSVKVAEGPYDAVVGFNKMPGLDYYFAADPCFAAKAAAKGFLYRMSGRCRTYLRMEAAVFAPTSGTRILSISDPQQRLYMRHYGTPAERFYHLPPGISPDRLKGADSEAMGESLRHELALDPAQRLVLMVGNNYRLKGVDRAIRSLASLPRDLLTQTVLVVVGHGRAAPYRRLARRLGISDRVCFMGTRNDVPRFLMGADLLLHPAYEENTGTVLIEALAAELPVLVTEVCGYSHHIRAADAGEVVPEPFRQADLDRLLARMLAGDRTARWRRNARAYVAATDIFSLTETAVKTIETVGPWSSCRIPG